MSESKSRTKTLLQYVLPAILTNACIFLFTIIDGVFVGHGVGSSALGAVNIAMPFVMIATALNMLTSIGGVTVTAIRLGRHDKEGANQAFMHSLTANFLIAEHKDELKGTKPFFYVQHSHPAGTLTGERESDTTVSDALSNFPNAVAFSGHSHESLALDNAIWQGKYTSIGTSALSYIWLPDQCIDNHNSPATSPMTWASDLGKDAMIVEVLDNGVLSIESRQMVDDEPLCGLRMVAVPPRGGDESWAYSDQKARAVAPEFPAGAKIVEWREQGLNRVGCIQNQVVLSFPSSQIVKGNGRAVIYRIDVFKDGEDKPVHSSNIVAPLYFRAPSRAPKTITARIATSSLPECTLTYKVSPVDCWGNAGKCISLRVEV